LYIAIILSLLILIGSLISIQVNVVKNVSNSDKLLHVLAYATLNLSWLLAHWQRAIMNFRIYLISLFVLFYGIIIEVLQRVLTNYREFDYYDIIANFIGISLSVIFFKLFLEKKL
jgi:VanZ family protein